jgi:glycosyltransferase involved in cell wall biosynthesis
MRILFVADGRSPIAINWIEYFSNSGHEVHLVTTFDCKPALKLASLHFVPVAFSAAAESSSNPRSGLRGFLPTGMRTKLRSWLGPLTIKKAAAQLQAICAELKPDLVHAMRIPYEGMLAAAADPQAPLLISVWGNDFTLHAPSTPLMRHYTRMAMRRADALHSDTQRDVKLAARWGFEGSKSSIVLPGNGGVRSELFYPLPEPANEDQTQARLRIINPRGMRAYVRNDVFFQAIPLVLRKRPEVRFLCPDMENEPEARRWVDKLHLSEYVNLMPKLSARALADSYHSAQIMVSPSTHDGTPNSLLEAMACGVFPVVGDIESLREWITHGENGLLVDPNDPEAVATGMVWALKDTALRARAAEINIRLVKERADYNVCMPAAETFYQQIIGK